MGFSAVICPGGPFAPHLAGFRGHDSPWGPFAHTHLGPGPLRWQVDQMFQFATVDAAGNLDYKALSYVLTHGEEKEE